MDLGGLAIALVATLLAFALGLLGSISIARHQLREELRRATDGYRREREDREEEYRRERRDRDAEYRQERADRDAQYARERREREDELLDALMNELRHNTHVCKESFDGLRYGTTQHAAMAASLGVTLPERAREAIQRAYAFASAYDDLVRALTPEARLPSATYDASPSGRSAAAAREYGRTARGDFEVAQQMLAEALAARGG